jgi:hypothetical protein
VLIGKLLHRRDDILCEVGEARGSFSSCTDPASYRLISRRSVRSTSNRCT